VNVRRLRVAHWFALVVGLLLAVAAIAIATGVAGLDDLTARRLTLLDRIDPADAASLRLSGALVDEESGVRGFVIARREDFLEPYHRGRVTEQEALGDLHRLATIAELDQVQEDTAAVRRAAETWRSEYAEPAVAAARSGGEPPSADLGKQRFDAVRTALRAQQRDVDIARRAARKALDDAAADVKRLFIGSGVLIILAVLVAAFTLRQVVIRPIARLARGVRRVATGDFQEPLVASGPRELYDLGSDVDGMRARIAAEVTALRDAERALIEQARELQRSNQELEQFAYVASHDLQEPLRKVASFTQMLQRRYSGQLDERADRYIEFAVDGAKRMQELINDLLDFSRVGRTTRPHEPVDCDDLVEEALRRLAARVEETGGEVVVDGDLPVVMGDAGLLTAVFQNLISNGLKFRGDAPPRIEIAAERAGGAWRFSVTDNGIGIDDEYAERIFVIFQRLHTRDAYEGTGIGLAMCRKIVEYHGGRIWLAPAEAGRGARFDFTLPAAERGGPQTATEETPVHEHA